MDNVIRAVTGLRPYRPQGFVVRSEDMDGKIIVHNYGHGGSGLTLGWGSSALAVRELAGQKRRPVAVLGSGIMGLTSARLLQQAGWPVTIYTRDPYRHTTSNVAAGEWGPFGVADPAQMTPAFESRLVWAAQVSHHAYTNLTGPRYGIRWMETWEISPDEPAPFDLEDPIRKLNSFHGIKAPGEHPFGNYFASHFVTMQMDPGTLLRQLLADFQLAGGRLEIRNFKDLSNVLELTETVVFNCTGLGSRALFGDEDLVPAKGQLVFMPPDPGVDYMFFGGGGNEFLHMFPRSDVILMGGFFRSGDWTTHVEADQTERIVTGLQRIFADFG